MTPIDLNEIVTLQTTGRRPKAIRRSITSVSKNAGLEVQSKKVRKACISHQVGIDAQTPKLMVTA
jgi:hypothetical protein